MSIDIDQVVTAYLECALWTGLDWTLCDETLPEPEDNPRPLDEDFSVDDIAPEALDQAREDCESFVDANIADIDASGQSPEQVGHDFYLTRNNHGAGFWDRGLGEIGSRLTDAAHVYGTSELYPADDGKLYFGG